MFSHFTCFSFRIFAFVSVSLLSLASSQVAAGTTYYLTRSGSPDGDDTHSGLEPDCSGSPDCVNGPFATLTYALTRLAPGDTLQLRGGDHIESAIVLGTVVSGDSENPITVTNFPGETPVIRSDIRLNTQALAWWVFDGLTFHGTDANNSALVQVGEWNANLPDTGPGSQCSRIGRNLEFRNSRFQHSSTSGILLRCADNVLVENCEFDNLRSRIVGSDRNGIQLQRYAINIEIRDNRFTDIGGDGVQIADAYIENVRIVNNDFLVIRPYQYRDSSGNSTAPPGEPQEFGNVSENGVDIKGGPGLILVAGNRFSGFMPTVDGVQDATGANGDAMSLAVNTSGVIIENNVFSDNLRHIVVGTSSGEDPYPSRDTVIRGNIFASVTPIANPPGLLQEAGGVLIGEVSDVRIYNNTFLTGAKALSSWGPRNSLFQNNLLVDGTLEIVRPQRTHEWQSSNNAWEAGLMVPPEFTSANDYEHGGNPINLVHWSPVQGSIVIDNGVLNAETAARTEDPYGTAIDAMPDIGAVEFYDPDGDGESAAADCDNMDPTIYPGALEVAGDGIDQDCSGADSTIQATASYDSVQGGKLTVEAVSSAGESDPLVVEGYDPMKWSNKKGGIWFLKQEGIGSSPGFIFITGVDGTIKVEL